MNFNQIKYGRNTTYITGSNIISRLVAAFKTRVLSDGGTFEAEQCLNTTVQNITANIQPIGTIMMAYINRSLYSSVFYSIGDSMTFAGVYQLRLQSLLGVDTWKYFNYGIGGETSIEIAARFNADIIANAKAGNYVIIWCGINDIANSSTAAAIQANLQSMYTAAKTAGLKVVAITITPFKGKPFWSAGLQAVLETVNTWILNTATGVDYRIDAYNALVDPSVPYTLLPTYDSGDYVHLSNAGYNLVGETIYNNTTFTQVPTISIPSNVEGQRCLATTLTAIT